MRGSAPATVATVDGKKVLRLPCNFATSDAERAGWDRKVTLDLSNSKGIQFQFKCNDLSPVAYFSIYFQSGNGWYSSQFSPEFAGNWNTITLDKASVRIEGKPAGWAKIQTLRISAWRGSNASTEMFISEIRQQGLLGADTHVAIIRAESAAKTADDQFVESMANAWQALGLPCALVSDLDVSATQLKSARLVVLPNNSRLSGQATAELLKYVQDGGKLLAFYSLPDKLNSLFGIQSGKFVKPTTPGVFTSIQVAGNALPGAPAKTGQNSWNIHSPQLLPGAARTFAEWFDAEGKPTGHAAVVGTTNGLFMSHVLLNDDPANKRRLLLAMGGFLVPELWKLAAQSALSQAGRFGGYQNLEAALSGIERLNTKSDKNVQLALTKVRQARDAYNQCVVQLRYSEAIDQAALAQHALVEAYCRAQPTQAREFRAFWCHSAFGVQGMSWDAAMQNLATNGFTAVLPNMLWGGVAYYPSKLLPVAREVASRGDQIAECLAAARKHGLQVHVWKVNWNLGHNASKSHIETLRQAGRLQADSKGEGGEWLCPSHPENQKLEIDAMLEVARNYAVDGIHFDYIRYPGDSHCFCPGCRTRFEKATGQALPNWPKEVLGNGALRSRWLDWRRENITTVVKAVSEQSRVIRPGIKISAAVFRNWNTDRDHVGQDWKIWCDKGYLDFVCPMDYTPSNATFENMVTRQLEWAGRVPCYPGIGASTMPRPMPDRVIEQIQITRKHRTGGFTIFNYSPSEARELLPLLGMGTTAK
jgi:uncharacterized lipoprotein YddW (UPF0748 family)